MLVVLGLALLSFVLVLVPSSLGLQADAGAPSPPPPPLYFLLSLPPAPYAPLTLKLVHAVVRGKRR